jgi:hypothetical protein
MSRFSIVRWLQAVARQSRRSPRKRRPAIGLRPARFAPRLEVLEDRTLLSAPPLLVMRSAGRTPTPSVSVWLWSPNSPSRLLRRAYGFIGDTARTVDMTKIIAKFFGAVSRSTKC